MTQWTRRVFRRADRDPVAEQLREVERRGRGIARLAHLSAFLVLVVFSAGSLVGLTGDALTKILAQWHRGVVDIPSAIAIGVSTLLVVAMDIGMVYAASIIRVMKQRRQDDVRLHAVVIGAVAVVEAASYIYMSWLYDHPVTWLAWLIICARGLSAPLLAAYLSLAEVPPIGERDILYAVERVTAHGVITEMVHLAGANGAPLDRKLALYRASTQSLDALISAEAETRHAALPAPTATTPSAANGHALRDAMIAIPAHPSKYLPQPTSPRAKQPAHDDDWGGDDPDGPGGGVATTDWNINTAEMAAISRSMNGNGHHNDDDWPSDSGDDDAELADSTEVRVGKKRPPLNKAQRAALNIGQERMRLDIATKYDAESHHPNPGGLRKRLYKEGIGCNDAEAARLLRVVRGEEESRYERATKRERERNNDALRFARAVGMSDSR